MVQTSYTLQTLRNKPETEEKHFIITITKNDLKVFLEGVYERPWRKRLTVYSYTSNVPWYTK